MASCLLDAEGQADEQSALSPAVNLQSYQICARGELIGYVKSKPLGPGQIISMDVLVIVMIIAIFHKKLI